MDLICLERQGGSHGIGGTLELAEKRITTQLAYMAMILADCGTEALKGGLDALVGQLFVLLYQCG